MVEYDHNSNCLKITIPNSGLLELAAYKKSILLLLSQLEVDICEPKSKENLKVVYELLSHLEPALRCELKHYDSLIKHFAKTDEINEVRK